MLQGAGFVSFVATDVTSCMRKGVSPAGYGCPIQYDSVKLHP